MAFAKVIILIYPIKNQLANSVKQTIVTQDTSEIHFNNSTPKVID